MCGGVRGQTQAEVPTLDGRSKLRGDIKQHYQLGHNAPTPPVSFPPPPHASPRGASCHLVRGSSHTPGILPDGICSPSEPLIGSRGNGGSQDLHQSETAEERQRSSESEPAEGTSEKGALEARILEVRRF